MMWVTAHTQSAYHRCQEGFANNRLHTWKNGRSVERTGGHQQEEAVDHLDELALPPRFVMNCACAAMKDGLKVRPFSSGVCQPNEKKVRRSSPRDHRTPGATDTVDQVTLWDPD